MRRSDASAGERQPSTTSSAAGGGGVSVRPLLAPNELDDLPSNELLRYWESEGGGEEDPEKALQRRQSLPSASTTPSPSANDGSTSSSSSATSAARSAAVNTDGIEGDTTSLVHQLSVAGDVEGLRALLKTGDVDVEARLWGYTPLLCACVWGRLGVVRLLLDDFRANILAANLRASTVLHVAARAGHLQTLELLLSQGAAVLVSRPDVHGSTPLHEATNMGLYPFLSNRRCLTISVLHRPRRGGQVVMCTRGARQRPPKRP